MWLLSLAPFALVTGAWRGLATTRRLTTTTMMEPLDEASFDAALDSFDGLSIVKFAAPWCRTCRAVGPIFNRFATECETQDPSRVRFFEVNFKESKSLCLRERVFALPTVHFYTKGLGRVNGFTLKSLGVSKRLRNEVDRYLGDSDHLGLLQSLHTTAISPMVRYADLISVIEALSSAPKYMSAADDASPMMKKAVDTDERRADLERLFSLLDANNDGVLDAEEIASIAAAVGPLGGGVSSPAALITCACTDDADTQELDADAEAHNCPLTREAFVSVMISKAASEFNTPDKELLPAFRAIDTDGDGEISREEMLAAVERLSSLNLPVGGDMTSSVNAAFDALDVDKSGSLDYSEWVAMMSGTHSDYLADVEADVEARMR